MEKSCRLRRKQTTRCLLPLLRFSDNFFKTSFFFKSIRTLLCVWMKYTSRGLFEAYIILESNVALKRARILKEVLRKGITTFSYGTQEKRESERVLLVHCSRSTREHHFPSFANFTSVSFSTSFSYSATQGERRKSKCVLRNYRVSSSSSSSFSSYFFKWAKREDIKSAISFPFFGCTYILLKRWKVSPSVCLPQRLDAVYAQFTFLTRFSF